MKRAFPLVAGLVLLSCSSPDPKFFTLLATTPSSPPATQVGGGPRTLMVRRPSIPGYLDRPDIVRSGGNYQLSLHSGEQWGEPFGDLLGRILVEDLSRRLPGTSVYAETGAISADPDATLEVDVQRFDAGPSGLVTLAVQWSLERGRGNPAGPPVLNRVSVAPASPATADVVAAMSTAMGEEADTIAASVRALSPGAAAAAQPGRARRPGR